MGSTLSPRDACGQLLVGGFEGSTLPPSYARALREGRRGGAILFRRNLPTVEAAAALCAELTEAAGPERSPWIGVDQEGGRVRRLPPPFLQLPPMRALGASGQVALLEQAARAVGRQLRALGFNLNFAPVLDVDSNPDNPIIGDRAFASDPALVAERALVFARGLQAEGVMACGKHFPGHGDTAIDSHVGLPVLLHARARLDALELPPFRAAAAAGVGTCASMMTAHVVCEALDPGLPATLSRRLCTDLLRGEFAFEGLLFSDDLEMGAVAALAPIEDLAVRSVRAGCDVLLICRSEELQDRALEALLLEAERDPSFARRCVEAAERSVELRRRFPARGPWPEALRASAFDDEALHALTSIMQSLREQHGPSVGAPAGEVGVV